MCNKHAFVRHSWSGTLFTSYAKQLRSDTSKTWLIFMHDTLNVGENGCFSFCVILPFEGNKLW